MTDKLDHPGRVDFKLACTVELNFTSRVMVSVLRKCSALPTGLHESAIIILQCVAGKVEVSI
jgi:hypothetical protein